MSLAFLLGFGLILTHELDAMTAKEWRIFPWLSRLEDDLARRIFVAAHMPLFVLVLWGLTGPNQSTWVRGFDVFLIAHVGAHLLLHNRPENGFRRGVVSWTLLAGPGLAGAVDLLVT